MFSRFRFLSVSLLIGGAAAALVLGATSAGALEIKLPPETARYVESPLPGYALTTAMCSTCHSADYTRMQPQTMTRAAWKANVTKMQKTFGAPIPDDAIESITDYIVKTYGAERAAGAPKSENPAARATR
jgi:cytochrome c5